MGNVGFTAQKTLRAAGVRVPPSALARFSVILVDFSVTLAFPSLCPSNSYIGPQTPISGVLSGHKVSWLMKRGEASQ